MAKQTALQLKLVPETSGKELTKEQKNFNRLTKRIENLGNEIKKDQEKYDVFLAQYSAQCPKLLETISHCQLMIAHKLDASTPRFKYSPRNLSDLEVTILTLCDDAFNDIVPDEKSIALYNKWSDISFEDELADQQEELKLMLIDMFRAETGIEIDPDMFPDLENATPEEIENFKTDLLNKVEENQQFKNEKKNKRKKTKQQIEKEIRESKFEKEKLRSLRSIYLSLAKVLHPDTAEDTTEQIEKDALMKQVTEAYRKKDLPALLKLELKWIQTESDHIETLTDEKLSLYNAVLKEQVGELKMEKDLLRNHPRYLPISEFMGLTAKQGQEEIKMFQEFLEDRMEYYQYYEENIKTKKSIIEFVHNFLDSLTPSYDLLDILAMDVPDHSDFW